MKKINYYIKNKKILTGLVVVAVVVVTALVYVSFQSFAEDNSDVLAKNALSDNQAQNTSDDTEKRPDETNNGDLSGENQENAEGTNYSRSATENETGTSSVYPYKINDTNLVIESISSYDGPFVEDGSDDQVTGVAAITVRNSGETDIEFLELNIDFDGDLLTFTGSVLPAGKQMIILEKNRKSVPTAEQISSVSSTIAEGNLSEMNEDSLELDSLEKGMVSIRNLTDELIPSVRVFYKSYDEATDTYLGGITYTASATELPAYLITDLRTPHFDPESSKVTMIRIYDDLADDQMTEGVIE